MNDLASPAHTSLLAAGIPIIEHLCGLEQLLDRSFRFFAAPPGGASWDFCSDTSVRNLRMRVVG